MPHKIQIKEADSGFRNSIRIWIGWLIWVLAMIIRVDMETTHMVIIVLKIIYNDWVWHQANILALVNIILAALNIEVLGIITMELILHNPHLHITLMMDPLANHLSLLDLTHKHTIIFMKTIHLVFILIAGIMIMMILYLIAIQCENDYISRYLWMYFVQFTILCMYFNMFLPTMRVFMLSFYV